MNDNFEMERKNNKGLLLSIVGVLTLIVAIVGVTYAYFQATDSAAGISGTAATAGLNLQINPQLPTTAGDMIPQSASAINQAATANCLDGNGNTVCKVYQLVLTNTGNAQMKVNGTITFSGNANMPNLKWAISNSQKSGYSTTGTTATASSTALESNVELAGNGSHTIYLVVWIDETGSPQTDSGTFSATVTYNSASGQGVTSTITS